MRSTLKLAFGAIIALAVPASSAEPVRIGDPDKFSAEIVETISKKRPRDAAGMIANTIGKPDSSDPLLRLLQVFEGRSFDSRER
jgi:hypothetical protein